MDLYYILPPQDKYPGAFIFSTEGVGSERYYGDEKYELVKVLVHASVAGPSFYTFIFECDGHRYQCSPSFPLQDGLPVVRVDNIWRPAPPALEPFSDPDTAVWFKRETERP